ncbi:GNAT family N-acetyltransferase [Clostridium cadaveris]|uniref:GNAT family N-acetyltransferase n=1 Tax=Clostridium cadaveris TaxID=1529 RepID=UPI000C07D50D|nr:GNAT family N-acetyltransferase [Clostridium cadaveris]UFH63652.1 GNAT family N-acetyltransferase [Clostridium cadaveris]
MENVYEKCPSFEGDKYLLRLVTIDDAKDLLEVYSDKNAVPFFNSDNCNGDDFHYDTLERMKETINFWITSYEGRWFVRWSIIDKAINKAIGTIELFHRNATDYFNNVGLLRLDLRSDYEKEAEIIEILDLIKKDTYELFNCDRIATKAIVGADERVKALIKLGFKPSNRVLIGHDGSEYNSYFEINKGYI